MIEFAVALSDFHPLIRRWFLSRFAEPTEPQRLGWPHISAGEHTLISAPTGSGKTLTAFLAVIDRLLKEAIQGELKAGVRVVYVSPLRALSNDMHRNLSVPLDELNALATAEFPGVPVSAVRVGLRTGDSTPSQRAALVRRPPHIIVTTPESLYLLMSSPRGREALKSVETVIVDEIHALVRDRRGSHLALTLERLEAHCGRRIQRIGLSATQKPIERIAEFLVGGATSIAADGSIQPPAPNCRIVNVGHARDLDLAIEVPPSDLSAVCSTEQWAEVSARLVELIESHRSTLIFVNTRRMAERVTHQLSGLLGENHVGSHHGSLSSDIRLKTEQQLKSGELKAVVATASLELGLDVGFVDLVIQLGSPRSIAAFLQRIGRSGHALGKTPKGRLFALTRDELVECMGLIRAIREGRLDVIPIPESPLDVLMQQIVSEVSARDWETDALFEVCRRAWPYRLMSRRYFDDAIRLLSEGLNERSNRDRLYVYHDHVQKKLKARPAARLAVTSNAGAIPEVAQYRVLAQPDGTVVGSLDEDFATESQSGQIFLLGNTSWRIEGVRGTDVHVTDAAGAPPTIPFWRGEAPGRTIELSHEVSALRSELEQRVRDHGDRPTGEISDWLVAETLCSESAAKQTVEYVAAQVAAVGLVPTKKRVIFERFFDETGGMQMVVHAPFGARITRAWGLAMRKRFCVSFDFELQATADDDGFILSLGPQHSFPLESMFPMLTADNVRPLLETAILRIPMFQIRWRWNANRALLVLRREKGQKVPPALQRFRSDDLLTQVFPLLTGCQENVGDGDLKLPDHPLLKQTMDDCLYEALDFDGLTDVLRKIHSGEIELVARDTREPSPFSYELLNANPYAFLDGGEAAERRARAVATRRSISVESVSDLSRLDPEAIEQVMREARPLIRNVDELHDVLMSRIVLLEEECIGFEEWLRELTEQRRVAQFELPQKTSAWTCAERLPAARALFPTAEFRPQIEVPESVRQSWTDLEARLQMLRGLMEVAGPITSTEAAQRTGMTEAQADATLEALEGEGVVMRGRYRGRTISTDSENVSEIALTRISNPSGAQPVEWCHRRLLARIHRLTMEGLRKEIEPVSVDVFMRFLTHHHGLVPSKKRAGSNGLFEIISLLQGLDIPAVAWERSLLPARLDAYRSEWLDELCLTGEVGWGRLYPPERNPDRNANPANLTKVAPISLFLRQDLDWLLTEAHSDAGLSDAAKVVIRCLQEQGAVFAPDLRLECGLSPKDLDDVLGELISRGWLTADGFAGLRQFIDGRSEATPSKLPARAAGFARQRMSQAGTGRWSLLRKPLAESAPPESTASAPQTAAPVQQTLTDVEQWAWQLLRRWGVVFRDLLIREDAAPRWFELLQVYRRLEARGELRGGRFITGVAGEQFALPDTVQRLRQLRGAVTSPAEAPQHPVETVAAASALDTPSTASTPAAERPARRRSERQTMSLRQSFLGAGNDPTATIRPTPLATIASPAILKSTVPEQPFVPALAVTTDELVIISAVDPLNLVGILSDEPRVPSVSSNSIALLNGTPVAAIVNQEHIRLRHLPPSSAVWDRIQQRLGAPRG